MGNRQGRMEGAGLDRGSAPREQGQLGLGKLGLCLLGLLCLFVLMVGPVLSAEPEGEQPPIEKLRVQVMPEFDDPRVLVIVQGRLGLPDSHLPVQVSFRLPSEAHINQMAVMDVAESSVQARPYDVAPDPDDARWSLVSYELDSAHFFYEYYYNPLQGETDKQFHFTFRSPQPVTDLILEVQQPLAATNFVLDPAPGAVRQDGSMGFSYHQYELSELEAGGELGVDVQYTKTAPGPSITKESMDSMGSMGSAADEAMPELPLAQLEPQAAPVETPAQNSPRPAQPAAGQLSEIWYFVIFGVVFILVAGGIVLFSRSRGSVSRRNGARCPSCGKNLESGARFCSVCGAATTGSGAGQKSPVTAPKRVE